MLLEINSNHQGGEQTRPPTALVSHKSGIANKTPALARIKVKPSGIPDEEKDKLLFELFDMLLQNNKPPPAALALGAKKCKVKRKGKTPFSKHTHRS